MDLWDQAIEEAKAELQKRGYAPVAALGSEYLVRPVEGGQDWVPRSRWVSELQRLLEAEKP